MDATPSYGTLPPTFGQDDNKTTGPRTPPPSKPEKEAIIDLTGEHDEQLSQALQASLNESTPTFGPSNRAPDPNWAMVSSNTAIGPPAYDNQDDDMKRALEASLMTTGVAPDTYDELPLEQRVRNGEWFVLLHILIKPILHLMFFY
ncbi:hypothetical protein QCA50_013466 [Cerrena zonata]|uniref:Uncharacterized protein n=1 Tax=Cerrena zonata TaxID=2478898 RepID=A0AAW0G140_9APHY